MHFQYAFLMAPRFFRNMHFSYFVDFVQKLSFSWNYAFLMVPRFSEICIFPWENAFLAGARCLSAGHHLRLTRGPAGPTNYHRQSVRVAKNDAYQLTRGDTYFSMKMHIFAFRPAAENAYSYFVDFVQKPRFHGIMHFGWLQHFFQKYGIMHFLQPAETKNMIFTWNNAYV